MDNEKVIEGYKEEIKNLKMELDNALYDKYCAEIERDCYKRDIAQSESNAKFLEGQIAAFKFCWGCYVGGKKREEKANG